MPLSPTALSIVVPCFNEQEVLPEASRRLVALLERLERSGEICAESRIYFVDDGSRDNTWALISEFVAAGLPVVGVKLARNRGHQNALLAGLFTSVGDAVITVDADLQDDLEAITVMVTHFRRGIDIVYGVRSQRKSDTWFKRHSAQSFYRLMSFLGVETVHNHADYRLMSARAVDALRNFKEVNLYLRGIVPLIGFRTAVVEYDRTARFAGESKYPLRKMLALALEAITSFSIVPLRLISFFGLLVFLGAMGVTGWALWTVFVTDRAIPGWASVVLPMYFLGGIQLLALGAIGEYMGKLYMEAKSRPRYFIEQILGGPET